MQLIILSDKVLMVRTLDGEIAVVGMASSEVFRSALIPAVGNDCFAFL